MRKNQEYEILTPTGWHDFDGITCKFSDEILEIKTTTTHVRCTFDHRFLMKTGQFKAASDIHMGERLMYGGTVTGIKTCAGEFVYDPVNVSNGNVYLANEIAHHNCEWLGSSETLIDGTKIGMLATFKPIVKNTDGFDIFLAPMKNRTYVMTVDPSEGKMGDYSAFVIFDITEIPYKVAAKYRNKMIHPLVLPEVVAHYGKLYNDAYVLVETNNNGQQIADILFYDIEYENMYISNGVDLSEGGGGTRFFPGSKTTKKTKMIGCSNLKLIIENDKLSVNDIDIVEELSTFNRVGSTYKADEGKHDDLAMCLVNFAYLTTTDIFKNLYDFSLRNEFIKDQLKKIEEDELPIGYFNDGSSSDDEQFFF